MITPMIILAIIRMEVGVYAKELLLSQETTDKPDKN